MWTLPLAAISVPFIDCKLHIHRAPPGTHIDYHLSLLVSLEAWPPVFHDARISLGTNLIKSQESEEGILLILVRGILVMEGREV